MTNQEETFNKGYFSIICHIERIRLVAVFQCQLCLAIHTLHSGQIILQNFSK